MKDTLHTPLSVEGLQYKVCLEGDTKQKAKIIQSLVIMDVEWRIDILRSKFKT